MLELPDRDAPKKIIQLNINSELLKQAQDFSIGLSAALEQALTSQIKAKQAQLWLEQNRSAIAAYNKSVNEKGVFSDGVRSF